MRAWLGIVLVFLVVTSPARAGAPSTSALAALLAETTHDDSQLFNVAPLGNPWTLDPASQQPKFDADKAFLKTKRATLSSGLSGALIDFEYRRSKGKKKTPLPALSAPMLAPPEAADHCQIAARVRVPAQPVPVRVDWGEVAFVVDGVARRAAPDFVSEVAQGLALAPQVAPAGAALDETVLLQGAANLCDEILLGGQTRTIELAVPLHLPEQDAVLRLSETYTAVPLDERQALQWQLLLERHPPRPRYKEKPAVLAKFPELDRVDPPPYPPRTLAIGGESWFPWAVLIGAVAPVFGFGLGATTAAAAYWLLAPTVSATPSLAVAIPVGIFLGGVPGVAATTPIFLFAALVDFFFWYDARPEMRATDEDIKTYNVAHAAYMVRRQAAKDRYNQAKKEYRDTEKVWKAELEGRAFWIAFEPVLQQHQLSLPDDGGEAATGSNSPQAPKSPPPPAPR